MSDVRVSDLTLKTGCLEDNDRFYMVDSDGIGGFTSHGMEFSALVAAIHKKMGDCYGQRFVPCRLALNDIRQEIGENIFTDSYGTVSPQASGVGATDKFLYHRTNIHLNNRLTLSKGICVCDVTCSACDGMECTATHARMGLYLTTTSETAGPSGEELLSVWLSQGASNNVALSAFDGLLEHENGDTVLAEDARLDLYGNDNSYGNIAENRIRKITFDAGTEGTATYYSFDVAISPANPQLTVDMMLAYTWNNGSGDYWSNHPDPSALQVRGLLYLEGFLA